jgi:hypothetical protein
MEGGEVNDRTDRRAEHSAVPQMASVTS